MYREASALPARPNQTTVPSRARDRCRAVSGEGALSPAQTASQAVPVRATRAEGVPDPRSWRFARSDATSFSSGYRTKICETLMLTGPRVAPSLGVLLDPVLPGFQTGVPRLALPELVVESQVLSSGQAPQPVGRGDADFGFRIPEQGDQGGGGFQGSGFGDDADRQAPALRLGSPGGAVQEPQELRGRQVAERPERGLGGIVGGLAAEDLDQLHRARRGFVVRASALLEERMDPGGLEGAVAQRVGRVQLGAQIGRAHV